jgi:hypothetical protein
VETIDIPNVWYSPAEMQHNRYVDGQWTQCYSCFDPYLKDLLRLLGMACGKVAMDTTDYSTATEIADAQVRGLEREISPCFRKRKRQVIANVLRSQAGLASWKRKNADKNQSTD